MELSTCFYVIVPEYCITTLFEESIFVQCTFTFRLYRKSYTIAPEGTFGILEIHTCKILCLNIRKIIIYIFSFYHTRLQYKLLELQYESTQFLSSK